MQSAPASPASTPRLRQNLTRVHPLTTTATATAILALLAAGMWCADFGSSATSNGTRNGTPHEAAGAANARLLHASGEDNLADSDGDFLPDSVEWVLMTNPNSVDTDADGVSDFVEAVQYGAPRTAGAPLPLDHEMRAVMTGPGPGRQHDPTTLHLFFRFVGGTTNLIQTFQSWIELPAYPGLHIPLNVLAFQGVRITERPTPMQGTWLHLAIPMLSPQFMQSFLPCSIHAQAGIGGNVVQTDIRLLDVGGVTCALVPFRQHSHVLQSIGPVPMNFPTSNKVCELVLELSAQGQGGSLYEVVDADCEDCNDMECGPTCLASIGTFLLVPGGPL